MPLKLDFKSKTKLIINGAVIENAGVNAMLVVHNEASIMRDREILSDKDATTPASRAYFALQCAYVFPDHEKHYIESFHGLLASYIEACPSAQPIADKVQKSIEAGRFYKGLRDLRELIDHERHVFDSLNAE